MTDGLSADVGRLLDAAAGATEAVLSDGAATPRGIDLVVKTNVTVLRTETHLPPVTPTTPLHQVMAAIATDGLGAVAEPAAPGAPDPAMAPGPERQLVRTLDIRLEPPDLGSVTVKLRLSGEHLTLRISADSAATARSLEQDRDTLASMLRSNGYSPEISAVRHEPAAAASILTASGTDSAPSGQSGAHQAGSQGAGDGGARSQSGQPGSQQQSQPGFAGFEPTDGHDADVQDTAARSGLYL
jgi:chemotaxis protein MotD